MDRKKIYRILLNLIAIIAILIVFLIVNIKIDIASKQRLSFVSDGGKYCYGIDSLEREENELVINGWFLEMKSLEGVEIEVSDKDAEQMLALVPIHGDDLNNEAQNAVFLKVRDTKIDRPDVNEYLSCEYDYSKCGFVAAVSCDELNLEKTAYRLVFKPDAMKALAVLLNVYLTDGGIIYTDPTQSPELDTDGTELDKIVKEGVRLVSRPDFGCYVYQLGKDLYWIADDNYAFCENGETYIQYQMNTTQVDNLPEERLMNNWFWSNIGDLFERHEITSQIDCGKYRVSKREIPSEYSVTDITTGYNNGEWVWKSKFKPLYTMLMSSNIIAK